MQLQLFSTVSLCTSDFRLVMDWLKVIVRATECSAASPLSAVVFAITSFFWQRSCLEKEQEKPSLITKPSFLHSSIWNLFVDCSMLVKSHAPQYPSLAWWLSPKESDCFLMHRVEAHSPCFLISSHLFHFSSSSSLCCSQCSEHCFFSASFVFTHQTSYLSYVFLWSSRNIVASLILNRIPHSYAQYQTAFFAFSSNSFCLPQFFLKFTLQKVPLVLQLCMDDKYLELWLCYRFPIWSAVKLALLILFSYKCDDDRKVCATFPLQLSFPTAV